MDSKELSNNNLNSDIDKKEYSEHLINAKIFSSTDENINICAEYIRKGGIVGMPTETVYGLAANAFDITAVKKIFEFKGRPLSDPLIVHITSIPMAESLVNFDENTLFIFKKLTNKFWPGPLTTVLKANFNELSPILTANTEFIGLRYPKNDIAKKLIEYSGVPIAAPSANKFCHVSPVNPQHVFEDFKEFPVYILDGGVSNFCMESTVIKIIIEENNFDSKGELMNKIQILRMGAISKKQLEDFLEELYQNNKDIFSEGYYNGNNKLKMNKFIVEYLNKEKAIPTEKDLLQEQEIINKTTNINHEGVHDFKLNQEAPGQFIKHYSPNIDTYILDFENDIINGNSKDKMRIKDEDFENCVVLDYNEHIKKRFLNKKFLRILDLSKKGNITEVMQNLYNHLRLAEKEENPKYLLLCDIEKYMPDNPDKLTLIDRISKASSSRKIYYFDK